MLWIWLLRFVIRRRFYSRHPRAGGDDELRENTESCYFSGEALFFTPSSLTNYLSISSQLFQLLLNTLRDEGTL